MNTNSTDKYVNMNALIEYRGHFPNEVKPKRNNGGPVKKRKVHSAYIICGTRHRQGFTLFRRKVTCKRCLRILRGGVR